MNWVCVEFAKVLFAVVLVVTTCSRAVMALDILREKKGGFDIVLSDVYMPDMDGFKLLEHIGLEMDLPVISKQLTGLIVHGVFANFKPATFYFILFLVCLLVSIR